MGGRAKEAKLKQVGQCHGGRTTATGCQGTLPTCLPPFHRVAPK